MLARGRSGLSMILVLVVVGIIVMEDCGLGHKAPHRESSPSSTHAPPLKSATSTWIFVSSFGCEGGDDG